MVLDPAYPNSAVVGFQGGHSDARFWLVPEKPERRPHFMATMLELMGDWTSCCVWRHLGSWPAPFRRRPIHRRQDGGEPFLQFRPPFRTVMREHVKCVAAQRVENLCGDVGWIKSVQRPLRRPG
jgi:hypothetical protein